jgi:hypothetical protein
MTLIASWAFSALGSTPSPTGDELDPTSVSPGVLGFLATFGVVVVSVLLMADMVRRVRRLRYRELQAGDAERVREADGAGPEDDGTEVSTEEPTTEEPTTEEPR